MISHSLNGQEAQGRFWRSLEHPKIQCCCIYSDNLAKGNSQDHLNVQFSHTDIGVFPWLFPWCSELYALYIFQSYRLLFLDRELQTVAHSQVKQSDKSLFWLHTFMNIRRSPKITSLTTCQLYTVPEYRFMPRDTIRPRYVSTARRLFFFHRLAFWKEKTMNFNKIPPPPH